jgi:hypothetical protein
MESVMIFWFLVTGLGIGILAAALAGAGNPKNMGICAACFIAFVSTVRGKKALA